LEEQAGRTLTEDVEDDLDGRHTRILDRLQRLLDLLDAHAVCADEALGNQPVAGLEDSRFVVDLPRRTMELDEINDVDTEVLQRALQPAAEVVVGVLRELERCAPTELRRDDEV